MTKSDSRRFKARLVASGYTQREDIDFKEVFSLVVRHASIMILLSLTVVFDMELDRLHVKTTFYMVSYKRRFIYYNLKDTLLQTRLIMYACSRSLSMA